MQYLGTLFQVLTKFNSETLKRPTKGAMTGFFRRAHQQKVSKNEMDKQIALSTNSSYQ